MFLSMQKTEIMEGVQSVPRVNGKMLSSCVNQTVRLVGKVLAVENKSAQVEASDGQKISVLVFKLIAPFFG